MAMFWAIKQTLTTFKKTEIMLSMLFEHKQIKLEINNRNISEKFLNIWN